jgi:threonine dehydrogenase-like Zn-dependent dehydrogenase
MPTGGLADAVMLVPGTKWFCVPEQLSDPVAALANCAIATAAAACRQYGIVKNRHVAVLGAGVLGVAAVAMACHGGAQTIIAVDPNADCRARALRFGATHVFDNRDKDLSDQLLHATDGRGPDLVLEFSGADDAVELALNIGRIGATIILAGSVAPSRPIYVDPERIVRRMYNLHGVHNYHPRDLGTALAFLAETNQRFSWNDMIADQLPLTETTTAFRLAQQNVGVRVAVVP